MTEAMPFLQKYDITFLRPPAIATLPLLSLRDIFPRPGEVSPQGDGFRSGGKVSGIAQRRPLGGAGTPSGVTEGVKRRLTSASAAVHTAPD